MKITNAKILIGREFVHGGIEFNDTIQAVGPHVTGASDLADEELYIVPGLFDMHTHGAMDCDSSDGCVNDIVKMAPYYAARGVTTWLPTSMTLKEPELMKIMAAVRCYQRPENGARVLGINMEGPFVSAAKCGAQNPDNIYAPNVDIFHRLQAESDGLVKVITIAPEEQGGVEFAKAIHEECVVSVGHTTASFDIASAAYRAGATHTTHLFNAMPPLAHRAPGVIGAAVDADASAELICDGYHIHPSAVRLAFKLFGEKLCLISDSGRCAGMPDGDYSLGDQPITLRDGAAFLKDTNTLACSSIHLMDAVLRAISFGIDPAHAFFAASTAPARAARLDSRIGILAEGREADLVILDNEFQIVGVYINGKLINNQ